MAIQIPTNNAGDRRLKISLGDNVLTIRTYFNRIVNFWAMDIATDDGDPIATGLNIVAGINLIEWSQTLTDIYGQFRVTEDARGQESLAEVALVWFAPGEFEELEDPEEFFSPPINYDFDALFPEIIVSA